MKKGTKTYLTILIIVVIIITGIISIKKIYSESFAEVEITVTPTWIIDNEKYPGVASIDVLKDLTEC
tara:strand:- start:5708 stop:5908 length:201 start_codon:yes stop_codon:yes gene_type:complete